MKTTPDIIADVLANVMHIVPGRIWIQNQKYTIPDDPGMTITVGLVDAKPYSNVLQNRGTDTETRTVAMQELISIDARSANKETLIRLPEILASLHSTYALEQSETYGMKIAQTPQSVLNTSEVEGSSMITRFTVTFFVLRSYTYSGAIDYFDTFTLTQPPLSEE